MNVTINAYSPAALRVMSKAMLELADIEEQEQAQVMSSMDAAVPSAPDAPEAPPADAKPTFERDDGGKVKLGRSDHKKWADHFIDLGTITHQEVYEVLSAAQRKRVDEALNLGNAGPATEQKPAANEKELRASLQSVLTNVAEIPDDVNKKQAVGAIRAHFEQILNEQGTTFEKPSQSLIQGDRLAGALAFAEKVLADNTASSEETDEDDPFG